MQAVAGEFSRIVRRETPSQRAALAWLPWASWIAWVEKLALGGFDKRGVGVLDLTTADGGEQLGDAAGQRFDRRRRSAASRRRHGTLRRDRSGSHAP